MAAQTKEPRPHQEGYHHSHVAQNISALAQVRPRKSINYRENMAAGRKHPKPQGEMPTEADRLDELLDEALQDTFPASDPIAVSFDGELRPDADRTAPLNISPQ